MLRLQLSLCSCVGAATAAAATTPTAVERWGQWEGSWRAPTAAGVNPFTDVDLTVELRGPGSADGSATVRGFYDGAGVWRARFMPPTTGSWTYRTRCPGVAALDGKSGSFAVAAPTGDNHGPVIVRKNSTTFQHADGSRFHVVGTTIYGLAGGVWGGNTARPNKTAESLATLAASPFNKVRMMAFPVSGAAVEDIWLPYERVPGSNDTDLSRFNVEFWQRMDRTIGSLLQLGIQSVPTLLSAQPGMV